MSIVLYIAAIVAANVITARTDPAELGPFVVAWGTWFIGATFVLRDLIQRARGRRVAYMAIAAALVVSALVSLALGFTLAITLASALAFAVSESLDTEVFTRLRVAVATRVAVSGLVGGLFDSAIFVTVGLAGGGLIPWTAVPNAIAGQYLVKAVLQLAGAGAWRAARGPEPVAEPA